jgi:O-antigen ligase
MPAEQALTKARELSGPSYGSGGDGSGSFAARLEQTAALLAPVALIVGLGLGGGGFDVSTRHIAGLAVWLVVVGLLVLGAGSRARLGWPFYSAIGLFGCLALLSAISSLWSGSVELSVIEADRVLVYLAFFLAAYLIAQTDERRQRFAEGIAIGVAITVLLGLASRLLPHIVEVSEGLGSGPRLRYPLGYWNANGTLCGIAFAMLLWLSRNARWTALRWASVAVMPAIGLTLYFTYSRGGLLSLAIGALCLIALSRDRLWMLATLAIAGLGALPGLLAIPAHRSLADNVASQTSVDQGVTVLLILLAGTAVALGLFALLRRLEAGDGQRTRRALRVSRDPAVLKWTAVAIAVAAIVAAIVFGGRAWHQFSSSDLNFPTNPAQHFSDLTSAGRRDFWRVAIDAFAEKPLLGHGAGTYQFSWEHLRSIPMNVIDAHSLYLEAFAELGLLGGLLVLGLIGSILWFGIAAWRAAPGRQRETYAALFAAMLIFAIAAGFDWFWEIAGLGAVFFLAAGALVAARCGQIASPADGKGGRERNFGVVVAGVAVAWLAAIALVGPLLVEREIESSQHAVAGENITSAVDHADTARSIEPWAASPYLQLGLIAEREGEYELAAHRLSQAIEREEGNWELFALRSRIEASGGDAAAAHADLEKARELNPLAPQLKAGGE